MLSRAVPDLRSASSRAILPGMDAVWPRYVCATQFGLIDLGTVCRSIDRAGIAEEKLLVERHAFMVHSWTARRRWCPSTCGQVRAG